MIKFIVGNRGSGKTKELLLLANETAKTTDGHVVYIDDDKRHIYDLHYDIRFVDTENLPISNYREFVGFIYGIISQNNDIKEIFIDGLTNIIKTIDNEALLKLTSKLNKIVEANDINFVISMNCEKSELPEDVQLLVG